MPRDFRGGEFQQKTPNEPDRWNWGHCEVHRNPTARKPGLRSELIMPDLAGETLLDGYQLAASSPGMTPALARELTLWGPAHDALYAPPLTKESVAWFILAEGLYCLAVTQSAGSEYSGRQGPRIYTHFIVLPKSAVERLPNPAWDLFHALRLSGRFVIRDPLPKRLERCPISVTGTVRILASRNTDIVAELQV